MNTFIALKGQGSKFNILKVALACFFASYTRNYCVMVWNSNQKNYNCMYKYLRMLCVDRFKFTYINLNVRSVPAYMQCLLHVLGTSNDTVSNANKHCIQLV